MKKWLVVFFPLINLLFFCCVTTDGLSLEYKNKEFYTAVNLWAYKGEILSTNYHVNTLIPAGTKVEIASIYEGDSFVFKIVKTGEKYTFVYIENFSVIPFKNVLKRVLSSENVMEREAFSALERENILAGTVAAGMSKKAVLVAYGYPPAHKTPDLNDNDWLYWINRFNRIRIVFENGKVSEIIN